MSDLFRFLKETIVLQDLKDKSIPYLHNIEDLVDKYYYCDDKNVSKDILEDLVDNLNQIISNFNDLGFTYEPDASTDISESTFKRTLLKYKEQIQLFISNFNEDSLEAFNTQTRYLLNLIDVHRTDFMDEGEVLTEGTMFNIKLDEAIEVHDDLNPKIWNTNMTMKEEVLKDLNDIATEFINYIEIPLNIVDIEVVGSNASFNYNSKSDIDLHIIVNFALSYIEPTILQELYNAKKNAFNEAYDLSIKGIPVELYIEDILSGNATNGRYSILKQEWIKVPVPITYDIPNISKELSEYEDKCDKALKSTDAKEIENLINDIYMMRKLGLAEEGEASIGNLVFKELRGEDYIKKLREKYYELRSEDLSIR